MEEKNLPLEIEKKFLIRMPDLKWILENTNVTVAKISQTYLGKRKDGFGDRVRKMIINGKIKYFYTSKKSISGMTRIEIEREISQKEYFEYMSKKNKSTTLKKTRYIIEMNNLKYEIDIYPFWEETAIMEIELKSEKQKYKIPDFIDVIGDVTNNKDYSNSSLGYKFRDLNVQKNERSAGKHGK